MTYQTISIHPAAPAKPAWGAVCNGCGVCCLAEPCPVGVLVSRRRHGACAALQWQEAEPAQPNGGPGIPARYVCGLLVNTAAYTGLRSRWANRWLRRLASRMVSAGRGCDSDAEVLPD